MKTKFLSLMLVIIMATLCACKNQAPSTEPDDIQTVTDSDPVEVAPIEEEEEEISKHASRGGYFEFESEDLDGTPYDSSIYKDYDLTMVNVYATWCPPCIEEMPDLEKIYQEYEGQGVNLIAFVLDGRDLSGQKSDEAIEAAIALKNNNNTTYPILLPDEGFLNGMLITEYVPTTYFIDSKGYMIGGPVVGSNDYNSWSSLIKERLRML